MKIEILVVVLSMAVSAHALTCWVCENVGTNDECLQRGRAQRCQNNQQACHNEVRRGSFGILITKRCKQALACDNNFIQNPRAAWFPTQCNSRTPSSVCRCCCDSDLCNRDSVDCAQAEPSIIPRIVPPPPCISLRAPVNGQKECFVRGRPIPETEVVDLATECEFECDDGFRLVGFSQSICDANPLTQLSEFNRLAPSCEPNTCTPPRVAPENGAVRCSDANRVSSTCDFECDEGFELIGSLFSTCEETLRWSHETPTCIPLQCNPPHVNPINGNVTCDNFNNRFSTCNFACDENYVLIGEPISFCAPVDTSVSWTTQAPICTPIRCLEQVAPSNGNVICTDGGNLESICQFTCNNGFNLVGNDVITCFDEGNNDELGQWTSPPPFCQEITCPVLRAPTNGDIACTNNNIFQSICSFSCDENDGFSLFPTTMQESVCRDNGDWDRPIPCCARACPPFAVMDLVLVLDSSSSIGEENWEVMKDFIKEFIESFEYSSNYSRLAVFRYNRDVDNTSQILLNSFVNDRKGLLNAYDDIPYDGSGTFTGQAIEYVNDVVLTEENGNRPGVQDVVIVITDGRAQDGEVLGPASNDLRSKGALTYVVGIRPNSGSLDRDQLNEIGGSPDNVFVAQTGFEGLGELLQDELSGEVCENRCLEEQ